MNITVRVAQPGYVQTASIRDLFNLFDLFDLFGLHPGQTLSEAKL